MIDSTLESLTNEELVEQYQNGNDYAGNLLWTRNILLVHKAIHRYGNLKNVSYDDKMSASFIAFTHTLKNFDVSRGYKLSTYLMLALKTYITRERFTNGVTNNSMKIMDYSYSINNLNEYGFEYNPKGTHHYDIYFGGELSENVIEAFQYGFTNLKPECRNGIIDILNGKKKQKEVAEEIGVSKQTISAQVCLLRKYVKEKLDELGYEY